MNDLQVIDDELWDHYSGLPSPMWYQQSKQLQDEEETADTITNSEVIAE